MHLTAHTVKYKKPPSSETLISKAGISMKDSKCTRWKLDLKKPDSSDKDALYRVVAPLGVPKYGVPVNGEGGRVASYKNIVMEKDGTTDVWLDKECVVQDNARISCGARLKGAVLLKDCAHVTGEQTSITGDPGDRYYYTCISDQAIVEDSTVYNSELNGHAHIIGQDTCVLSSVIIDSIVDGGAVVQDSDLLGNIHVSGPSTQVLNARLEGNVTVTDGAIIDLKNEMHTIRRGDFGAYAVVRSHSDYMTMEIDDFRITVYNSSHPDGPCIGIYPRNERVRCEAPLISGNGTVEHFFCSVKALMEKGHAESENFAFNPNGRNGQPSIMDYRLLTSLSTLVFQAYDVLQFVERERRTQDALEPTTEEPTR